MSLLTGHILNGKIVGVEIQQFAIIKEPFKIEDTPSLGYADISSVKNWWDFGRDLNRDYSFVRKEIKLLVEQRGINSVISSLADPPVSPTDGDQHFIIPTATGDWVGYEGFIATWDQANTQWIREPSAHVGYRLLDSTEKDICAELKIGSSADHYAEYGVPAIVDYGVEYHRNSIISRKDRFLRAQVEVYNRIPLNAFEVLGSLINNPIGDLTELYQEYGLKGSLEDYNIDYNPTPTPAIVDYLLSRAPFNGQEPFLSQGFPTGLSLQAWTVIDATPIVDFANELVTILVDGVW